MAAEGGAILNPRLFTLALIEAAQGFTVAVYQGLEVIRRGIEREARQQARTKRMVESVHRDLERL